MSDIKPISGFADRTPLAAVIPLQSPFTLNVFPSDFCNFRCSYCAQFLGMNMLKDKYPHMGHANMTISTMENIVKGSLSFQNRYKLVSFMGHGEPLIHPLLPEMIALVRDAGIAERIEIITNASLLTHELSRKLVDAGVDNLRVSLQGLSASKYKEICGASIDFEAFLENIAYYHEYASRHEAKIFVKVVDAALESGEEELFYKMFDTISDRMYIESIRPVYEGISYADSPQEVLVDRYDNAHASRKVCPLPFYMLNIWPDGTVAPCDAIYKPSDLGNCNSESLADIWSGEKLREFQLLLLKGKENIKKCVPCCAPDDVSHPADALDDDAERIADLLKGGKKI
ncbi:radical SAM protein [Synergistales bacterium]|nr:radical SAM protein [Synergistales bacterium]